MNLKRAAASAFILGALALGVTVNAHSASISGGTNICWLETTPGTLTNTGSCLTPSNDLDNALAGDAADPGGNVELSKFGGPVTTLTVDIDGKTIILSSLIENDWTANSNMLAIQYIQGAAFAAFGTTLSAPQLSNALNIFLNPLATLGNKAPWQLLSDPNISYVQRLSDGLVHIGLAGFFDATFILQGFFPGAPVPAGAQASEVVKVKYGSDPFVYRYSFSATPSNVAGPDGISFTGNYDVTVPEPGTLLLLVAGLAGLASHRRLMKTAS